MADLFNKHMKRTKEKLLEGIGKNKATQDEVFDNHAANLSKQSKTCERLYKDLKAYSAALKTLCGAERTLLETIRDTYEPEWPDREVLSAIMDNIDIETSGLDKKISEELTPNVSQYVSQFADLRKRVDKRGRKLVDYDSAKNAYHSAKSSSKKGDSDPKVAKAFSELQNAETMYTEINKELLEVLPATYDSRITFIVDSLQTFFNTHSHHHNETARLSRQVVTHLDKLGQSMDYLRVPRPEPRALTPIEQIGTSGSEKGDGQPSPVAVPPTPNTTNASDAAGATPVKAPPSENGSNPFDEDDHNDEEIAKPKFYPALNSQPPTAKTESTTPPTTPAQVTETPKGKTEKDPNNPFDESDDEEEHKKHTAAEEPVKRNSTVDAGPAPVPAPRGNSEEPKKEPEMLNGRKVLSKVKSTHEYKAEDTDELSFGPGEIIKVLEAREEDQLDAGWLMGALENGKQGVFPANFTKPQ